MVINAYKYLHRVREQRMGIVIEVVRRYLLLLWHTLLIRSPSYWHNQYLTGLTQSYRWKLQILSGKMVEFKNSSMFKYKIYGEGLYRRYVNTCRKYRHSLASILACIQLLCVYYLSTVSPPILAHYDIVNICVKHMVFSECWGAND